MAVTGKESAAVEFQLHFQGLVMQGNWEYEWTQNSLVELD